MSPHAFAVACLRLTHTIDYRFTISVLTLSTPIIGRILLSPPNILPTSGTGREGIYPPNKFPFVIGKEASGTVVSLPTDRAVLDDPDYQERGYKEGTIVAVVGASVYGRSLISAKPFPGLSRLLCRVYFCTMEDGLSRA